MAIIFPSAFHIKLAGILHLVAVILMMDYNHLTIDKRNMTLTNLIIWRACNAKDFFLKDHDRVAKYLKSKTLVNPAYHMSIVSLTQVCFQYSYVKVSKVSNLKLIKSVKSQNFYLLLTISESERNRWKMKMSTPNLSRVRPVLLSCTQLFCLDFSKVTFVFLNHFILDTIQKSCVGLK